MKTLIAAVCFLILSSILFLGCAGPKVEEPKETFYLAYNLWFQYPNKIEAINFKGLSNMLPIGTPIQDIHTQYNKDIGEYMIYFNAIEQDHKYRLFFNKKYQTTPERVLTNIELIERTFTTKTLEELTEGLKPEEIENIRNGTIQRGMSRRAVLLSWGYPPIHKNPDINAARLIYWKMRLQKLYVDFDENDRVRMATWYGLGGNEHDVIQ